MMGINAGDGTGAALEERTSLQAIGFQPRRNPPVNSTFKKKVPSEARLGTGFGPGRLRTGPFQPLGIEDIKMDQHLWVLTGLLFLEMLVLAYLLAPGILAAFPRSTRMSANRPVRR
jgi:hypothetical protein